MSSGMVPFFNSFYDERFIPVTTDDDIKKILDNYEKSFIEKYDFWKNIKEEHINVPYELMVNKMLASVERPDLHDVLFEEITYDEFCVRFLDYLKDILEETKMFGSFVLVSVLNQIITQSILNKLPAEDFHIWEQYYDNLAKIAESEITGE